MMMVMRRALAETHREHTGRSGVQVEIELRSQGLQAVFAQEKGVRKRRIHRFPTVKVGGVMQTHAVQKPAAPQLHTARQIVQTQEQLFPFPLKIIVRIREKHTGGKAPDILTPAQ